jgi:hypothetical protein
LPGIRGGVEDTLDAGFQESIRAGGSLAVVIAGLEAYVGGGPGSTLPGLSQSMNLGMRAAVFLVPALSDHFSVLHEDAAYQGVGMDPAPTVLGQVHSPCQEGAVQKGE